MKMKKEKPLSSSMRRFLYIISSEKAKARINKFREKWGIPEKGFRNNEDYYLWVEAIIAHPPIKLKRVIVKAKITGYSITKNQIVKGKAEEPSGITPIKTSQQRLFNDNFQKAIDELGVKIRMDNNWTGLFANYLLKGKKALVDKGGASLDILKTSEFYEKGKPIREKFLMFIEPNTTREQVLSAWERFIEKEKKSMTGFIKIPPNWKPDILR